MSILSLGMATFNGAETISETLSSIVNQSFEDFTLYILDNQSSDSTYDICQSYVSIDPRVILIKDTQQRDFIEAQRFLFSNYLTTKYIAFVCDDDLYGNNFLEDAVAYLDSNSNVNLFYPLASSFVDNITNVNIMHRQPKYSVNDSNIYNALKFSIYRNCVPIFFGVYRRFSVNNSWNYFRKIDAMYANHDNIFIFHYLLSNQVHYSKSYQSFYYRLKTGARINLWEKRGYTFFTLSATHQFHVLLKLLHILFLTKPLIISFPGSFFLILSNSFVYFLWVPLFRPFLRRLLSFFSFHYKTN